MTELDAARGTTRDTGFVPRLHYGICGGRFGGAVMMPLICAVLTGAMWASWSTPGFVLHPAAPFSLSLTGFLVGLMLHVAAIVLATEAGPGSRSSWARWACRSRGTTCVGSIRVAEAGCSGLVT